MTPKHRICLFLACVLLHSNCGSAQVTFTPAVLNGIVMGKSKLSDVIKRFGTDPDSYRDNTGRTWLQYKDIGPVPGNVMIVANANQTIEMADFYPVNLSLNDAKKLFGSDYNLIRYDWDKCLSKGGGEAPIYESAKGPLQYLVYPKLGIAMLADENPVSHIMYLAKPLGAKRSQCGGS